MSIIYIDDAGIHSMRQDEILAFIQSIYYGIYGTNIDISTATQDGQFIGSLSEMVSDVCQVAVQVYNARSPAGATGAALARLLQINGLKKKDPAPSTGTITLGGTPGSPIPAGTRIGNSLPGVNATFITTVDTAIGGGGTVDVGIQSTVNGPIPGLSGDLTVILTVTPGLASATNAADVTLGTTGETDSQARTRRAASVAIPSQGILDGLYAALAQLDTVEQVVVRENPEDTTQTLADGGTLAPHAIQAIILGGLDADIAKTMWLKKSSGVTMVGSVVTSYTDAQGVAQPIKYDRPVDVDIYVKVNTPAALTTDQKNAVAQAIEDRGNGLLVLNGVPIPGSKIGEHVDVSDIYNAITYLKLTSMPLLKVDEIDISTTASPTTDAPIVIAYNAIAAWSAGRVTFSP